MNLTMNKSVKPLLCLSLFKISLFLGPKLVQAMLNLFTTNRKVGRLFELGLLICMCVDE
jgi:hypothetical protein